MARIRDKGSLDEALDCVVAAQLMANDEVERNNLKKLHGSVMRTGKELLLPAAQCAVCKAELQGAWLEAVELLLEHVPEEVREKVESLYRELFSRIREDGQR